jgi:monoamine oxidase
MAASLDMEPTIKRSLHSPLSGRLRRWQSACEDSHRTGVPVEDLLHRRTMLRGGLAAMTAAAFPARARAASDTRVVIVGSGLAGLNCARLLWLQYGIRLDVFEWDTHIGGRVETLRNYFAKNLVAEEHGEFISSEHHRMRALAAEYGLGLENVSHRLGNTKDTGWFDGREYGEGALVRDWQKFAWALFRQAVESAPSATWRKASATARQWDHMSVTEWVDTYVPGGAAGPFGKLCLADVISEYGGPPDEQSALNLIYIMGYDASSPTGYQPHDRPVVAGTDEKYHIRGGNDQIVYSMAAQLPAGSIHLHHRLLAVTQTAGRRYTCTFSVHGSTVEVTADHVVIAIPPTTLRDVELRKIDLLPVQQRALAGASLGSNAKIMIQVAGQPWVQDGFSGNLLTNLPVCGGWDAGTYQPGGHGPNGAGLYFGFPGGLPGQNLAKKYGLVYRHDQRPAPPVMVNDTLAQLEHVYPGVTAAWNAGPQLAWVNDGLLDQHLRGAYSYFKVGQYTSFAGAQSLPAGGVHFAGEHTSLAFQGFMEGGLESGERAAREIGG